MHKYTATVCQNADISKIFYLTFYKNLGLINSTGELSQKFTEPRINGPKAVFGIVGKII